MAVPKYDDLFNPLLEALHKLGGSATLPEMEDLVAKILNLSDEDVNEIHRGNRTKLSYRLAWARNYLKRYGLLENSSKGVWALTSEGLKTKSVDKKIVNRTVKSMDQEINAMGKGEDSVLDDHGEDWKDILINQMKQLSPDAFERLCQRILRESGFIQVEVTGRSGDGGIDGRGILQIGGLITFRVIFQCKRYNRNVTSQEIREFKGTMVGRAEKGLFMTTGAFTRDAKVEALRDGSPPIDLIDGEQLAERLKELRLGVTVKLAEDIDVNTEWFKEI
jgi:restriction system protein